MGCGQTYTQPLVWSEATVFTTSTTSVQTSFAETPKPVAPEGWLTARARARARRRGEKR